MEFLLVSVFLCYLQSILKVHNFVILYNFMGFQIKLLNEQKHKK